MTMTNTPLSEAVRAANHSRRHDNPADLAERAAAALAAGGLLRLPEVLALVPVSPSTWWAGIKTGKFPAGVRLSQRCTAWKAADIQALLDGLEQEAHQ